MRRLPQRSAPPRRRKNAFAAMASRPAGRRSSSRVLPPPSPQAAGRQAAQIFAPSSAHLAQIFAPLWRPRKPDFRSRYAGQYSCRNFCIRRTCWGGHVRGARRDLLMVHRQTLFGFGLRRSAPPPGAAFRRSAAPAVGRDGPQLGSIMVILKTVFY